MTKFEEAQKKAKNGYITLYTDENGFELYEKGMMFGALLDSDSIDSINIKVIVPLENVVGNLGTEGLLVQGVIADDK